MKIIQRYYEFIFEAGEILKTANRFWHLPSVDDAKRRLDCKLEKILEEVDKEKPTFRFYTTVKEWEQYRLAINSAEILEIFWKHVEFNNARAREILLPQLKKILEVEATKTPPQTGLAEGKATETPAPQAGPSGKASSRTIDDIVGNGESSEVEFKTSLRINQHTGNKDPKIELAVLRTIAGFLNTNGGTLVIGISDDGVALGIDADKFENEDKTHLHLVNLIKDRMSPTIMPFICARFEDYKGCRVTVIECSKAGTPVFVKDIDIERFYIRTGPSTTELSASKTHEYIKQHWCSK